MMYPNSIGGCSWDDVYGSDAHKFNCPDCNSNLTRHEIDDSSSPVIFICDKCNETWVDIGFEDEPYPHWVRCDGSQ